MGDILFQKDGFIFSYRVAGILINDGKILLQKSESDDGYAFPGGHVAFGETTAETLARELKEEIGADVEVGELKWVGENFWYWGDKPCHQICLTYLVELRDKSQIPLDMPLLFEYRKKKHQVTNITQSTSRDTEELKTCL